MSRSDEEENLSKSSKGAVESTLRSRQKDYGSYQYGTAFRADVMKHIRTRHMQENGTQIDPIYEQMIWDIVNKLSRLAVSPKHLDTIHDIVGYATLYENYVRKYHAEG